MVASESHVYVLYNDKSLEVLKADTIDQVVAKWLYGEVVHPFESFYM